LCFSSKSLTETALGSFGTALRFLHLMIQKQQQAVQNGQHITIVKAKASEIKNK